MKGLSVETTVAYRVYQDLLLNFSLVFYLFSYTAGVLNRLCAMYPFEYLVKPRDHFSAKNIFTRLNYKQWDFNKSHYLTNTFRI
jgi:hypothetical protein